MNELTFKGIRQDQRKRIERYQQMLDCLFDPEKLRNELQRSFTGIYRYLELLRDASEHRKALVYIHKLQRYVFPKSPKLEALRRQIVSNLDYYELGSDEQINLVRLMSSGRVPVSPKWEKIKCFTQSGVAVTLFTPKPGRYVQQPIFGRVWGNANGEVVTVTNVMKKGSRESDDLNMSQRVTVRGNELLAYVQGCRVLESTIIRIPELVDKHGNSVCIQVPSLQMEPRVQTQQLVA